MTQWQKFKKQFGLLPGFRGIIASTPFSTRYAIGTRQHRRIVVVRTVSQMEFVTLSQQR